MRSQKTRQRATSPVARQTQSYEELTEFNDRPATKPLKEIDPDAALTPELVAKLDEWRSSSAFRGQLLTSRRSALQAWLAERIWSDTAIDRMVRQWLNPLNQTRLLFRLFEKGRRNPTDYMGPGFGGRAHRGSQQVTTRAALCRARQIMDGQFRRNPLVIW